MRNIADRPYPGSRAFEQADQDRFHGRAADARTVADLWAANRLTIVTGPVSSGKTSLIQAGVYPLMHDRQALLLPVGRLGHNMTFPFAALPEDNPYTLGLLSSWSPGDVPTRLAGLTVSDFVRRLARSTERHVFLAIDQMDDLTIEPGSGLRLMWRRQFLAEIAQAYHDHPRLHLLLATRPEALDLIPAALGGGARHELGPLSVSAALDAVIRPAERAGRTFTDDAAHKIVDCLRTTHVVTAHGDRYVAAEHVEPALLQVACEHLWRNLPPDLSSVTEWAAREFGDVDGALAGHCALVISQVAAEHDLTAKRLRSWLLDTFSVAGGAGSVVPEGSNNTIAGKPTALARSLVDRHLLGSDMRSTVRRYQLLSDRLAEPLRTANFDRSTVPTAVDYLRAAERDLALGDVNLAQRHSECALRAAPSLRAHAKAEVLLGNVMHEQEKPADALPHYREAATLLEAADDVGAAARALAAVGQTLLTLRQPHEAVSELRVAVERAPSDLVLQTRLGLALWQIGDGQGAVAVLNGVLGIDGGNAEALRGRGEILAFLGEARSAMLDLERQVIRERPSTRAARGLALAELGDHGAATREIDNAVATAPHNGPVLLYAARATELTGDKAHTEELARRAVEATDPPLSPPHREVARKLAHVPMTDERADQLIQQFGLPAGAPS